MGFSGQSCFFCDWNINLITRVIFLYYSAFYVSIVIISCLQNPINEASEPPFAVWWRHLTLLISRGRVTEETPSNKTNTINKTCPKPTRFSVSRFTHYFSGMLKPDSIERVFSPRWCSRTETAFVCKGNANTVVIYQAILDIFDRKRFFKASLRSLTN